MLETMQRHRFDRVVHLAFIAGGEIDPGRAVPYVRVQCLGTVNVFEAARIHGVRRVVNASSVSVYGAPTVGQERGRPGVSRPPLRCLQGLERAHGGGVQRLGDGDHQPARRLEHGRRPARPRDPGAGLTQERVNFQAAPELAVLGRPVTMPPDEQLFDFIYAADTADAFRCALEAEAPEHRVFNLRSEQRRAGEMTACLRGLLPRPRSPSRRTAAAAAADGQRAACRRARVQAAFTLEQGIEQLPGGRRSR